MWLRAKAKRRVQIRFFLFVFTFFIGGEDWIFGIH